MLKAIKDNHEGCSDGGVSINLLVGVQSTLSVTLFLNVERWRCVDKSLVGVQQ